MSSALAIAGVSAVLRDLLNDGLINHDATGTLGTSVLVSVGPPDRVIPANGTESTRLNLFMYQVTPNTGWRNEGLPSRDASGSQRLSNPPLALNLHYLISAHASEDFHSDILLGYAMQLLHETPVLSREAIKKALNPSPVVDPNLGTTADPKYILPDALRALADSGLEGQIEQIRITPEYLNTEEMSKLWTATQSHLRPAAAYMASVVLIQAMEDVARSLPVLRRGEEDRGVFVQVGAAPVLQSVRIAPPDEADRTPSPPSWPSAQLGSRLTFQGVRLGGEQVRLRFEHPLMPPQEIAVPPSDRNGTSIGLTLPDNATAQTAWAAGIYGVTALVDDDGRARSSNKLPLPLAPRIKSIPDTVERVGGDAKLSVAVSPQLPLEASKVGSVWKLSLKQRVSLLLAGMESEPEPIADCSDQAPPESLDQITFVMKKAPEISHEVARLRVDGVDSLPFVRRDQPAPPRLVFDDNQKVTIT